MIHKNDMGNMPNQKFEISKDRRRTGPKRTVDNGVYYTIPGALFGGFNVEGSGYIYSMAMVPPFVNVTYANQMSNKSNSSWKVNDYDVPEASKVNGDFVYYYSPNSMSYTPVLGNKNNNTYQFNEDNYWTQTGNYSTNDISYVMTFSPDLMMTPCDIHGTKWYNGTAYRNTANGYGALSTGFLYGTGSYDGVASYGFEQTYNPLLAPLCVDEIHLNAITYNRTGPIPSGKSIKAYILALDIDNCSAFDLLRGNCKAFNFHLIKDLFQIILSLLKRSKLYICSYNCRTSSEKTEFFLFGLLYDL